MLTWPRSSRAKVFKIGLTLGLVTGLIALACLHHETERFMTKMIPRDPHQMLFVDSGYVKADAAVVLGGAAAERAVRAAELYREGVVKWVVVSGTGDTDTNILALERNGVPRTAILADADSRSTFQNAIYSVRLFRENNIKSVIVVTSWYHSRRALSCFKSVAPDLTFYSRPSYFGYSTNRQFVNGLARREWLKLLFYRVRYGIPLGG